MRLRDAIDEPGRADIGDDWPTPSRERGTSREHQRELFRQPAPTIIHDPDALSVRVVHEADVGVARAHERAHLRHRPGPGLRAVRKRRITVVIDRQHLAADRVQPPRGEAHARAVAAVECHPGTPPADCGRIERAGEHLQMMADGIGVPDRGVDAVRPGLLELALMVDVQQLLRLQGIQVEPIRPHELEGVPLGVVVPRRDGDAAARLEPRHRELQARRRTDAQVDDPAPRGQ